MFRWWQRRFDVTDVEAEKRRLEEAKRDLHHVRSLTPVVKREVRQIRAERQRNGIGPLLGDVFRGGR